jgi:hypothetical protein
MALTIGTQYDFDAAKSSPQPAELGTKFVFAQVTFDSSYAAGGLALTASDLGLDEVLAVYSTVGSGYLFEYDKANAKLKALYADYDAGADGALIEAASSASLGSISTWVLAVGR